jgi:AmiR/NasT family two-component response regulator
MVSEQMDGLLLVDQRGELRVVAASSVIDQAKGKLAERLGLDMDQAFNVLRDHARARNLRLSDLARAFIDGTQNIPRPNSGPTT